MSVPGLRGVERHSLGALLLIVIAVTLGSGCTGTPRIATGTLAAEKARVVALVTATGRVLGPRAPDVPVQTADELSCKKRLLGYSVGDTGAHHAEVTALVSLTGPGDGASLLAGIERYWRDRKYSIDRSGMSDQRFPKVRATVGTGELLVATGYVGFPQVNLYAVSPCVRS
jgi:hypothetical protein